jgi:hypothetical protein
MTFQYSINTFKELLEKYPLWEDLQRYLESSDGGLFRIVDKDENGFCLIRYEKGISKMNLPHSKWFRSIVWNTKINRPVCIAPSKVSTDEFTYSTLDELNNAGIICQEFLEGFMINCFKFVGDETLYITSRSKLDAAGKFYSNKTFRELFIESYVNTVECNENDMPKHFESPDSMKNEVAHFYSFLVQHKDHRIVKKNTENCVYLIHKGIVYNDGNIDMIDSPDCLSGKVCIPRIKIEKHTINNKGSYSQVVSSIVENESITEVEKWIKSQLQSNNWEFQGIVLKDTSGNRWRYRSEKYLSVKTLRGNSANMTERFTQLYTQNLITKYLEYYEEDSMFMVVHQMFFDAIIKTIYDNYIELHVTKVKTHNEIDKKYLPHLYTIHGNYLTQLRPNGKKITVDEIKQYFHKQPWQRIVFLIKNIVNEINC